MRREHPNKEKGGGCLITQIIKTDYTDMRSKKGKPIIIGVTGGLGTGKTTVANMLKELGAFVLDADKMAHKSLKKESPSYKKIVRVFGRRILDESARIDRQKLADIVFWNKSSLRKLCGIIHPLVIERIEKSIRKATASRAIVIDAPLLIESGLHKIADYLVVVKTSRSTQIERGKLKFGLTPGEIIRRIKNQMPLSKKARMADYVINNEGGIKETRIVVKKIWKEIMTRRRR